MNGYAIYLKFKALRKPEPFSNNLYIYYLMAIKFSVNICGVIIMVHAKNECSILKSTLLIRIFRLLEVESGLGHTKIRV